MELNPKQLNYLPGYATTQQPLPSNPIMMVNPQGKPSMPLSLNSQSYCCPSCGKTTMTRVKRTPNKFTHSFAFLFCITGMFCLVPMPYCLDTCTSPDHYCNSCNQYLGRGAS